MTMMMMVMLTHFSHFVSQYEAGLPVSVNNDNGKGREVGELPYSACFTVLLSSIFCPAVVYSLLYKPSFLLLQASFGEHVFSGGFSLPPMRPNDKKLFQLNLVVTQLLFEY